MGRTHQPDPCHCYRNPLSHPGPPVSPCGLFPPILGASPLLCARRALTPPRRSRRDKGTARPAARCTLIGHAASPTVQHGFWRRSSSHVCRSLPTALSLPRPNWPEPRCFVRPARTRGTHQNSALTGLASQNTHLIYPTTARPPVRLRAHWPHAPVLLHMPECQHHSNQMGRPP
jgi:hypothetical protein